MLQDVDVIYHVAYDFDPKLLACDGLGREQDRTKGY